MRRAEEQRRRGVGEGGEQVGDGRGGGAVEERVEERRAVEEEEGRVAGLLEERLELAEPPERAQQGRGPRAPVALEQELERGHARGGGRLRPGEEARGGGGGGGGGRWCPPSSSARSSPA